MLINIFRSHSHHDGPAAQSVRANAATCHGSCIRALRAAPRRGPSLAFGRALVAMKKIVPAANPNAYVAALDGWRRDCVVALRTAVKSAAKLEEVIKWGHLVYSSQGPVLLIRAEERRVLFGFWRGQRLREFEPRLKPGGKYEMATLELRASDTIAPTVAQKLVRAARALNQRLGDPTDAAKKPARSPRTPDAEPGANDHGRHAACRPTSNRNQSSDFKSSRRTRHTRHSRGSSLT